MDIFNLLTISNTANQFAVEAISSNELDWIGKVISWIFDLFTGFPGAIAIGVIVFTLCLKTIVLPLDIYSRVKTKKQALIMDGMRGDMEKLQKQYANDKQMYNQKVMELQKANGYNPLGACLPTVISLVIFMVIFSSFSTYSNFATLRTYNDLVKAYNESVSVYVMEDENDEEISRFLYGEKDDYYVRFDKFSSYYAPIYDKEHENDKDEEGNPAPKTFASLGFDTMSEADKWEIVIDYVQLNARAASAKWYRDHRAETSFGWIGSMWYPDSMLNKEVPDYAKFSSSISRAMGSGVSSSYEQYYNEVTHDLQKEKNTYNGYFVLIILAIGLMFLQQFIMMRSQKSLNELSTVDGSAAKTNKVMMIAMPVMFGFFSFFYSAAFSVYMITNTLYSLISTLIINKAVSVRFAKIAEKNNRRGGRPSNNAKRLK